MVSIVKVFAQDTSIDRPNIIFIMSDDQGFETLQSYGGESYKTPVTDKLAESGIRFTEAHAAPLCTPTRVQLMSGRFNSKNYTGFNQLDPDIYTFGNLFQDAGYATFIGGKWQLGGGMEGPYKFGFDEYALWQVEGRANRYANPSLEINGEKKKFNNGEYGPDIVNEYVLDLIDRHQQESFFVYYPMILPHYPNDPTPDSDGWDPLFRKDHEEEQSMMYDFWDSPEYFGDMIEYVEKLVGNVVDKLDELSLRENTLIIFTSDNGTFRSLTSILNGEEFTGGKRTSTDAGTKVPLVMSWPGVIPEGIVNNDLISFTYFFPTLTEAAGINIPENIQIDGQSILPVMKGEDATLPDWLYMWWNMQNRPESFGDEFARTHRYKLYYDGRFFDLSADPLEERDPLTIGDLDDEEKVVYEKLKGIIEEHTRDGFYRLSWKN